jgi:homocysteine S-methyltransferase
VVQPDLVADIHRAYVRAGAEILETNSYGANRLKLARYGLEDRVEEINVRAAQVARGAAGERALVAGAIGPLGVRLEPYGPTSGEEARAIFREQAAALASGGAQLFVLETFADLDEILVRLREYTAQRWVWGRGASCTPAEGQTEIGFTRGGRVFWAVAEHGDGPATLP